jgi:NAD(P)-dependent dehydrogenase (short-subunit alcohol dehydrogenase family)
MRDLTDKCAVVTGGDSGIGLGITQALLSAGMRVAITYRHEGHLAEALDTLADCRERVYPIRVDVSDRERMQEAADDIERVFGKIHVLCNNAGVGVRVRVADATHNDWEWALNVNVMGVAYGIQCYLPKIRAHGEGGHIVTTSSMSGLSVPPVSGLYATTKFAAVAMMEALRGEIAGEGIGVSVYCPGLVCTRLHETEDARPPRYAEPGRELDAKTRQVARDEVMAKGMLALEAGHHVLEGIRQNRLYILSHPEFETAIRERFEAILRAVPSGVEVPSARMRAEVRTLSNPTYTQA